MVHKIQFKKRAPRVVREMRKFVQKFMGLEDVRISPKLNKAIWSKGIRNLPRRMRVRIERGRGTSMDAPNKEYALVDYVAVESFKGLETQLQDSKA